jgi:hypothetical protein
MESQMPRQSVSNVATVLPELSRLLLTRSHCTVQTNREWRELVCIRASSVEVSGQRSLGLSNVSKCALICCTKREVIALPSSWFGSASDVTWQQPQLRWISPPLNSFSNVLFKEMKYKDYPLRAVEAPGLLRY